MASKTVLETLEAARKLITHRKAWTQDVDARNASGKRVSGDSPDAVCFCGGGAIVAVSRDSATEAIAALRNSAGVGRFATFNDTHTHAEVLAAFDAAIAKAKEAQHA